MLIVYINAQELITCRSQMQAQTFLALKEVCLRVTTANRECGLCQKKCSTQCLPTKT